MIIAASIVVFAIGSMDSYTPPARFVDAQNENQGICDRTVEIQLGILDWLGGGQGLEDCANITDADLASLTTLIRTGKPTLTSLKSGDFAGMTDLRELDLQNNEISELPADVFDGLDELRALRIGGNNIEELPAAIFSGLPNLQGLFSDGNRLTKIEADWFEGFEGGERLSLFVFFGNDIAEIDVDTFQGLTAHGMTVDLSYNKLRTLPVGLFDGMSPRHITLHFNEIESLPTGLFDKMTADRSTGPNTSLNRLNLNDNNLTTLPSNIFDELTGLLDANLHRNSLTSLPNGVFANNVALKRLRLGHNQLTTLPQGIFSGPNDLTVLDLKHNRLASLDGTGIETHSQIFRLHLDNNRFTKLPDAYVTNFVDDSLEDSPNACLEYLTLDNNPFSETWINSGKLNDVLTAFGRRDDACPELGETGGKWAFQLGLGGIDLDVAVTDENKTAWELITDEFANAQRYPRLHDFSFGWDGLTATDTVLGALPQQLEALSIQDVGFDASIDSPTFARFTTTTPRTFDLYFKRPDDGVLTITYNHINYPPGYIRTFGLQVLELDNVGLTGDGSSILNTLPASTLQQLTVKNNPDLTSVPSGISNLTNLNGLEFQNNGINSLGANAFSGLSDLYFLSFEGNEIATVDEDAFNGLSAVQILFLNDNEIESLDSGVLSEMTALRQVLLSDNEMLGLPSGLFGGLANLDTIQLDDNPGSPFQIGVSVVDDTTDPTMKQFHVREGAPYSFIGKIVEDGAVSNVVPVQGGATAAIESFTLPAGAEVELPAALRGWHGSDFEFCLGLDECMTGFEFVLNPKPSIVGLRFVTQEGQFYTAGDELRFEAHFDRDVVVEGIPQLSFELGDETRYAQYVESDTPGTLYFEYTLQASDPAPNRVSLASSMLVYQSGSSIKDPETDTVADATPRQTRATADALTTTTNITYNTARARIKRIEPTIKSVTVSGGDRVKLSVDIYGAQDIKSNGLADGIGFLWSDGDAGGTITGNGREVTYSAPDQPGTYTISVATPFSACRAPATAGVRCEATFEIMVRRASSAEAAKPEPRNPAGEIPAILTDSDGNQYEVFTPERGGTFTGDTSNLTAGPGVVPNGEIVGLRIAEGDAASNEGKTYQRYSLGGNWYEVSAVDGSGVSVASYVLNDALEVCIPLPVELSSRISGLAIVAINSDDSLTILSSTVRISGSDTNVCANVSSVPATIAVGSAGSPAPLPTAVPETEDETDPPDTGGAAPSSDALVWALMIGFVGVFAGLAVMHSRRRRTK